MKAVQFGAGNIGRGFLGELFHCAGYKIVFVEKDENLVGEINKRASYTLEIAGPRRFGKYKIDGISALKTTEEGKIKKEIREAAIIATSVGTGALPSLAKILAEGIEMRRLSGAMPVNVIIAENVLNGGDLLRNLLREETDRNTGEYINKNVGLVQAVVSRMVPVIPDEVKKKDPLYIKAEEYCELPVDKNAFRGDIPVIEGMKPCEHFEAYEERKLFIHNAGHAIAGYLGFLKGYRYIYEAMEDILIKEKVRVALREIGRALVNKYPFLDRDLRGHIEDLCDRFGNKALGDTVKRVCRDPLRKLKPRDRLVGACRLIERYGRDPAPASIGISACLLYDEKEDASSVTLQDMISGKGVEEVLYQVCGIKKEENLYKSVVKYLEELAVSRKR